MEEPPLLYGLDRELAEKAAAKYDVGREQQAKEFIEEVAREHFPEGATFQEALKDGLLLCKMFNNAMPNNQIKFSTSKLPFKQMENIGLFLKKLEELGVPAHDRFLTVDLYEAKNVMQVIDCIFAFARHARSKGADVPEIGPKLAQKNERSFSDEQLAEAKHVLPKLHGFSAPEKNLGVNFGGRREILPSQ